ncbi:MAG: YbhB/YbcL family Raf kinase inhibitor-like protein [Candidatus Dadabacteria bacterium]
MKIESSAFQNGEAIPSKYSCQGANINPPLHFSEVPATAKSLVLIVDDPDAPAGTWTHWVLWNIEAQTGEMVENSKPPGSVQGKNSWGKNSWGGPCPPSGTHRYFFKVYALDKMLSIPSSSDAKQLEKAMDEHIVAKGELMGIYKKG